MSEFPLHPNDDDLRDERVEALRVAIGCLQDKQDEYRNRAAGWMPGSVRDATLKQVSRYDSYIETLTALRSEIEHA